MTSCSRLILLAALAVLSLAGCAQREDGARDDRQGVFYGGILGGHSMSRGGPDM